MSSYKWLEKLNQWYVRMRDPLERLIFPLLLLLWPMAALRQGVSVMDTTYSLGNYRYLEPSAMWYFATLFANALGRTFAALPVSQTMIGMTLNCLLVQTVTALAAYFFLRDKFAGWIVFIGEWIALSLCWCPAAILYNYLTYLLLTLGIILLYRAVCTDKDGWYIAAGACLGLNVTVRFANLAEAALILALWLWCYLRREMLWGAVRRTLLCMAGYAAGFLAPVMLCSVLYGPTTYFEKIGELFGVTSGVESYTAWGMISSIAMAYWHSMRWFILLIICMNCGFILFKLPVLQNREWIKKVIFLAALAVLVRFYWGRGMFTTNYQDYWSMFEWGMQWILVSILLLVMGTVGKIRFNEELRFLCAALLITIAILPLGSNNYTFPVLNCLFLIMPFTMGILHRELTSLIGSTHATGRARWYPTFAAMSMLVLALIVQGSLFHLNFAFRDGVDGTKRTAMITDNRVARGMYTTPDNAREIDGLSVFMERHGIHEGRSAIVFGDAPGLHYLLSMPPALSTTWVDLDSYPTAQFEKELTALSKTMGTDEAMRPVVILHREETAQSASSGDKKDLLDGFIAAHGYETVYDSGEYIVLE